jgi:DNA polymerase III alpha subunit
LLDSKAPKDVIPDFAGETPRFRDFHKQVKLLDQLKTIDFIPESHILEIFYPKRRLRISNLFSMAKVRITGMVLTRRTIRTRNNKLMCFLTVDDETGILEVVIFPSKYDSSKIGTIMDIAGNMQDDSLIAESYKMLPFIHNESRKPEYPRYARRA